MRRSLALSYLLWGLIGLTGAHRFYLRSYGLGFLYLLTGGLFGVGWLVDAFLLPGRVDAVNRQLEAEETYRLAPARLMLDEREPARVSETADERDTRIELAILDAARKGDGSITAAEAALAARVPIGRADAILTEKARAGFCDIDNREDGTVCYRFFA